MFPIFGVDRRIPDQMELFPFSAGGELGSTGQLNGKWRVVVGQRATLKADYTLVAEDNLVLAA